MTPFGYRVLGFGSGDAAIPNVTHNVEYLIVAGGGGGGGDLGGAAGAGGYRTDSGLAVTGLCTITVGAGGAGHTVAAIGANGTNSSLVDTTTTASSSTSR
jgi:hypothetical protein